MKNRSQRDSKYRKRICQRQDSAGHRRCDRSDRYALPLDAPAGRRIPGRARGARGADLQHGSAPASEGWDITRETPGYLNRCRSRLRRHPARRIRGVAGQWREGTGVPPLRPASDRRGPVDGEGGAPDRIGLPWHRGAGDRRCDHRENGSQPCPSASSTPKCVERPMWEDRLLLTVNS